MKHIAQTMTSALMLLMIIHSGALVAQHNDSHKQILIDINHGQKFWNDPASMQGMNADVVERVKYMTDEIEKSAASNGAKIGYLKGKITASDLISCDVLFIHIPSSKYSPEEVKVVRQYLSNGGALFLVMDADYWSTLQQVNANDLLANTGIKFGNNSPDTLSGGYTKQGPVTPQKLKVTYHGARTVYGGTPFCYSNQSEANPFGVYAELHGGGKVVAMGDGMVSLYMTAWKDVDDYQCSEFMRDVFAYLLK